MGGQTVTGLQARKVRVFAAFAAAGVCVEWAITRTAAFHRGPAVPFAVLFDLVVVLPLLFAAVVLRPARRPLVDAAPVLAVGAFVAGALLATRADVRVALHLAGAAAELAVLTLFARRVRKAATELRTAGRDDLLLQTAALTDPVLRIAGAELVVLYYALVGPFVRRPPRPNDFTYREESGLGGLLFALGLVTAMEGLAVHLLLHAWSARAAWVLAALSAYGLLWLLAAFQAARLRPVTLSDDCLLVRTSLLWTAAVPRDSIGSVAAISEIEREKGTLHAALGTAPVLLLTLTRPVVARGPLGLHRSVRRIALYVDEPARLQAALEAPTTFHRA
jgi:hypothetical protein